MYKNKSNAYDVVALGELLIDFTENGISDQGNMLLEANPGGAPCNVLAMLANLGKKTGFIGKVGNDQFGKMLVGTLREAGIDTSGLVMDEKIHTTLAFVHTEEDGDRDFSFYRKPGADMMLTWEEVNEELVANTKIFHFGTLSMTDPEVEKATKNAVEKAKQSGAVISFDPNLREPLWESLSRAKEKICYGISQTDILKISEEELEFVTGKKEVSDAIATLRKEYPVKITCVTLGKKGSIVFYNDKSVMLPGFIQEGTIETTGAGDTFCACVLNYILEHGMENLTENQMREMLRFANASASIITTKRGALKVMPKKEDVEEFLRNNPE